MGEIYMAHFYVDLKKMTSISLELDGVSQQLVSEKNAFEKVQKRLVKQMPQLLGNLKYIETGLEQSIDVNKKYQSILEEIEKYYREHEKAILSNCGVEESSLQEDDGQTSSKHNEEDSSDNQFFAWLKTYLKWLDKSGYDDKAGITGGFLSYSESLYNFFTGNMTGLTGAKDWLDLGDKSIGLWTDFYDYLKAFYNGKGDIFSLASQSNIAKIGIGGNIFGLISDLCGAADNISNPERIGSAGIIGELFGISDNAIDIWHGAEKVKNIGDTAKNGIYSPLMLYTTIAKGYLSAIGQGFTSYEKYSADGSWDLGDTAATAIESSVSGLYKMVSTLTFGLISEDVTGVSAEEVSSYLEESCGNIGINAADYIKNDSVLNQKYQESGTFGRACLIFYAAFKAN